MVRLVKEARGYALGLGEFNDALFLAGNWPIILPLEDVSGVP